MDPNDFTRTAAAMVNENDRVPTQRVGDDGRVSGLQDHRMTQSYLVWMWQHCSLSLFLCDTLEEAVGLSEAIQDDGDGVLECIEGPEGVIPAEVIEPLVEQRRDAERARLYESPKPTHWITVTSPDGKHRADWESYESSEDAETALATLRERFGDRAVLHEERGVSARGGSMGT